MFLCVRLTAVHGVLSGSFVRYFRGCDCAKREAEYLIRFGWQVAIEEAEVSHKLEASAGWLFVVPHPVATHEAILAAIEAELNGLAPTWAVAAGDVDLVRTGT